MRFTWMLVTSFLLWQCSALAKEEEAQELQKLCPTVVVDYEYEMIFTDTEKRLLCGSPGVKSWENIPLRQAQYHMLNFLAARGYHQPTMKMTGDTLYVKPGQPTLIRSLRLKQALPELAIDKFWLPRGMPLTPAELNTIESWASMKMSRLGYPCAQIKTFGDPATGDVDVEIFPGELWTIEKVEADPIPGVRGGMLDRYRAFTLGDRYNSMLLEISADRLKNSQIVINSQYSPNCKEQGRVDQLNMPGKPRLVSFGFGFDSENYFTIRGSWRNSRLSETASLLDLSSTIAYRSQKLLGALDWFYLPVPSQHYLKAYLRIQREFEQRYEARSIKAVFAPAWTGDVAGIRGDIYLGPSLQFESTVRGDGPRTARILTLDLGVGGQSHLFEYFKLSPQSGYQFNLFASTSDKGSGSDVSATTYTADFTKLWNILSLEPEIWIFGLRGSFAATRPGPGTNPEDLPPSFKYFLGGSDEMRGFARKSLPNEGTGALTKVYLGGEMRLNNSLPYRLQPLVFSDWGWLGEEALKLAPRMFWSPGLGLRWESPIGVLRGSIGQGFVSGKDIEAYEKLASTQFYFSIGEQF